LSSSGLSGTQGYRALCSKQLHNTAYVGGRDINVHNALNKNNFNRERRLIGARTSSYADSY
jgi:hypothetical protein